MTTFITPPDVERFRAAVVKRLGLEFDDSKLGHLGDVLRRRLGKQQNGGDYLASLEHAPPPGECDALAEALTVTETYFFRNHEQFDALATLVLPDLMRRQAERKRLSLLSAACASGEEAYSLAITAAETLPADWRVDIRAVDLNPAMLDKARRGRYSPWALRETPPETRQRWFTPEGQLAAVKEAILRAVRFESVNLADAGAKFWRSGAYDVIFCRNALMYFSAEQRRAAIDRLTDALAPGGYLFLGHAETLTGVSDAFHLCHTHGTFYYRRKEDGELAAPRPPPIAPRIQAGPPNLFQSAWTDTIRLSSERVSALLPEEAPAAKPARGDLTPALALLERERFTDALASIGEHRAEDPDALLLSAVLLQQSGKLAEAEQACQRLLTLDELSAGAHYVLALCRENAGDLAAAAEHDRVAAYLDPAFAMPRLHLGLLARRSGRRETARRELAQALLLLEGEDASRLLMYGGGFNREALIALCRSALQESGGRP